MTYDPEKAAEVERLRTRIEELAESRAEMVEQRNALFEERQLALDRVAELEERKDTFLKALQEVTAKATEFKARVKELERERDEAMIETVKKGGFLAARDAVIEDLKARVADLERERDELFEVRSQMGYATDTLRTRVDELERAREEVEKERHANHAEARVRVACLETENERLTRLVRELEDQISQARPFIGVAPRMAQDQIFVRQLTARIDAALAKPEGGNTTERKEG